MRTLFLSVLWILVSALSLTAQRDCSSYHYQQQELSINPSLREEMNKIENFVQQRLAAKSAGIAGRPQGGEAIITIPVVVHILHNKPEENISDERVFSQIKVLNESFRRLNKDTANTPAAFKSLAADCNIEFQLAISDPQRRSTTGIIRKYTPITLWNADDKMKISAETGDDPWDPKSYLNIWVCNMGRVAGYSSFPGGPAAKDGIVIAYNVFGVNKKSGYEMGKTAVHEAGHWMGLRHIWGDSYCGDDLIDDTPKQSTFTSGCPSGVRLSCGGGASGDMYMNYMDITLDACTNLFTIGQKERMRASFETGGGRKSILSSYGLLPPLISEAPLPEQPPRWYHPHLYPNPAYGQMLLDIAYDIRWIGKAMTITNTNGQVLKQFTISSKTHTIDVSDLKPGVYFLSGKKEGSVIQQKFIKL
jgi:hypothetical protein